MYRAARNAIDGDIRLKAIYLATERISGHRDVHQRKWHRVRLKQLTGHHNHPCAGSPDGSAFVNKFTKSVRKIPSMGELHDCRALAAGDHQTVKPLQLVGQTDLGDSRAERFEHGTVFLKIALECQDAYVERQ